MNLDITLGVVPSGGTAALTMVVDEENVVIPLPWAVQRDGMAVRHCATRYEAVSIARTIQRRLVKRGHGVELRYHDKHGRFSGDSTLPRRLDPERSPG